MIERTQLKPRDVDCVSGSLRSGRYRGYRSKWKNGGWTLCLGGARQSDSIVEYVALTSSRCRPCDRQVPAHKSWVEINDNDFIFLQ